MEHVATGNTLNDKPASVRGPLKILVWAAVFYVAVLAVTDSYSETRALLVPLNLWVVMGALIAFFWQLIAGISQRSRQAIALRTLPELPPRVLDPGAVFSTKVEGVDRPAPTLSSNPLKFLDNQQSMKDHLGYLEAQEAQAGSAMGAAVARYRADVAIVETQQLALTRMGHQATAIIHRIEQKFPRHKADLTAVPKPLDIPRPVPPAYLNSGEYDRYASAMSKRKTQALNRGGVELARGDWQSAAIAVSISAAMSVIQYQKTVRAMQDADGKVRVFVERVQGRITELGKNHDKLRQLSNTLHGYNSELHALLCWFNANGDLWQNADQLNSPTLEKVRALARLATLHVQPARSKV